MSHPVIDVGVLGAVSTYILKDLIQWVKIRKNGGGQDIRITLAKLDTKMDTVIDRLNRQEQRLDRVIEDTHGRT